MPPVPEGADFGPAENAAALRVRTCAGLGDGGAGTVLSKASGHPDSETYARDAFVIGTLETPTSMRERSFAAVAGPIGDHAHWPGFVPLNRDALAARIPPAFPSTSTR